MIKERDVLVFLGLIIIISPILIMDIKLFPTGFAVVNEGQCDHDAVCDSGEVYDNDIKCSDCLKREGDTVTTAQYNRFFALNYKEVCQEVLKFEYFERTGAGISIHLSKDGTALDVLNVNLLEKGDEGYKVELVYYLFGQSSPEYRQTYTLRFNNDTEQLYMEDTSKACPVHCGDSICESDEDYLNCRSDCLARQGMYINASKSFAVNYDEQCEGIFRFINVNGNIIKILTESGEYYDITYDELNVNDKGYKLLLPHGPYNYTLRYKQGSGLYLELVDKGCSFECSSLTEKKCVSATERSVCTTDNGYYVWGSAESCGGNYICTGEGECKTNCTAECTTENQKGCFNDNTTKICLPGITSTDWCLKWRNISNCPVWNKCENGECVLACDDDCDTLNETYCVDRVSSAMCGLYDDDPCKDKGTVTSCNSTSECFEGACVCKAALSCGNWSGCINNTKTRICVDSNNCPSSINKLNETASCTECTSEWVCGQWSECTSYGSQEQTCEDIGTCQLDSKIETRNCVYAPQTQTEENIQGVGSTYGEQPETQAAVKSPPAIPVKEILKKESSKSFIFVSVAILFLISGVGVAFYEIKKSHKNLTQEKQNTSLNRQTTANMHSYFRQNIAQGNSMYGVKRQLVNEGWNRQAISKVARKIPQKHIKNSLLTYVSGMRQFSCSDNEIRDRLKKRGWDKKSIDDAMSSAGS